eukprot:3723219-Prymnesium_polylepis.2
MTARATQQGTPDASQDTKAERTPHGLRIRTCRFKWHSTHSSAQLPSRRPYSRDHDKLSTRKNRGDLHSTAHRLQSCPGV